MSIKSDKWIRRMALEHGMIEPFEAGQVRENGNGRIVSYGTVITSYSIHYTKLYEWLDSYNGAGTGGMHRGADRTDRAGDHFTGPHGVAGLYQRFRRFADVLQQRQYQQRR